MNTLQRMRQYNMGVVENSTHAITRQVAKNHLLEHSETCFNKHLIYKDIPKLQLQSYPNQPQIPEKYRKQFIHPEDGFVKKFCEEY